MERRHYTSRELRFWEREHAWPVSKRVAAACMVLILIVGLLAVWSV